MSENDYIDTNYGTGTSLAMRPSMDILTPVYQNKPFSRKLARSAQNEAEKERYAASMVKEAIIYATELSDLANQASDRVPGAAPRCNMLVDSYSKDAADRIKRWAK